MTLPVDGTLASDVERIRGQHERRRRGGRWSLRGRLLALVLIVTALGWAAGGVVTVRAAQDIAARQRDQRLLQLTHTVLAFARHELPEIAAAAAAKGAAPADDRRPSGVDLRYRYQVWREGRVLLHSPDALPDRPLAGSLNAGFSDGWLEGWRLRAHVSAPDTDGLQVQVAELLDPADQRLMLPGLDMLVLMLVSLAGVGALAVTLLVHALRPLVEAEAALRQRSRNDLEAIPLAGLPDEMRPLLEAFNEHLSRAAERLSSERGFTALAAHELRTPLAALHMQVQVAMRADDAVARDAQMAAVLVSVDRCSHLIDQLLTLARIEQGRGGTRVTLDLRSLCQRVAAGFGPPHPGAGTITIQGPALAVDGWAFGLETLVRNLLANALVHAPPGSTVVLALGDEADGRVLCVDDAGPGIPPADRGRVFERFVRLDRSARAPGVGLGLAIVRAVADAHGARVDLQDSPLGGLRVRVRFPAARAPAGNPGPAP
jgi:two-component system OmpR family sensor kinase/two-component system sensor histidine kinase QseC